MRTKKRGALVRRTLYQLLLACLSAGVLCDTNLNGTGMEFVVKSQIKADNIDQTIEPPPPNHSTLMSEKITDSPLDVKTAGTQGQTESIDSTSPVSSSLLTTDRSSYSSHAETLEDKKITESDIELVAVKTTDNPKDTTPILDFVSVDMSPGGTLPLLSPSGIIASTSSGGGSDITSESTLPQDQISVIGKIAVPIGDVDSSSKTSLEILATPSSESGLAVSTAGLSAEIRTYSPMESITGSPVTEGLNTLSSSFHILQDSVTVTNTPSLNSPPALSLTVSPSSSVSPVMYSSLIIDESLGSVSMLSSQLTPPDDQLHAVPVTSSLAEIPHVLLSTIAPSAVSQEIPSSSINDTPDPHNVNFTDASPTNSLAGVYIANSTIPSLAIIASGSSAASSPDQPTPSLTFPAAIESTPTMHSTDSAFTLHITPSASSAFDASYQSSASVTPVADDITTKMADQVNGTSAMVGHTNPSSSVQPNSSPEATQSTIFNDELKTVGITTDGPGSFTSSEENDLNSTMNDTVIIVTNPDASTPAVLTPVRQTTTPKQQNVNAIDKTDKVPVLTLPTTIRPLGKPQGTTQTTTIKPLTPPYNGLDPDSKPDTDGSGKLSPTVYISLVFKTSWNEFCSNLVEFQEMIKKLLMDHRKQVIGIDQVKILDDDKCKRAGFRGRRSTDIRLDFYLTDFKGQFSEELTSYVAEILTDEQLLMDAIEGSPFQGKVISVKVYGSPKDQELVNQKSAKEAIGVGITIGIVVATLVGLVVVGFVIFQILVLRKRRGVKMMRYAHDPRYSIDIHSIHEAIQLTGINRRENRFAYINPGLEDDERDHSTNPLTFEGLTNILTDVDTLEDEFLLLPNIIPKLSDIPEGAEHKNRYANVIPIPDTRVILKRQSQEDGADYINANFVRGHLLCPESYIATQAPMEDTREDFWQMVWDQHSQVIIMLTGLEEHGLSKCIEYWPNTVGGDVVRIYGDFEVIKKKREVKSEWILSILKLKNLKTKQERDVVHFWMTAWPIDGVPDCKTVINFLLEARPYMEYGAGPTVVHCSPGNGRTGTLLAIEIQMQSYDDTKLVDILGCLHKLREDRAGAVQNKDQYVFIYKVLLEYIKMLNSRHNSNASSISSIHIMS